MCRIQPGTRAGRGSIYCYSTTDPTLDKSRPRNYTQDATQFPVFVNPRIATAKTLLITTAQNATPVFREGWLALVKYAKHRNAEIVVLPSRYSNPTSIWSSKAKGNMWWDDVLVKHLHNERTVLNDNLLLLADINIIPTHGTPLSGMEGYTGHMSGIVGHMRAQTLSVPTPGHKMAKLMMTTGAITKANYIPSGVGKRGEHHHILGALIVELEDKSFWMRRLNMDTRGQFIDYDKHVSRSGVRKAKRPLGIEIGDSHVAVNDPIVDKATFGPKGIVQTLKPRRINWNDVFDGQSVNPHEAQDQFVEAALARGGRNNVEKEAAQAVEFLRARTPKWATSYLKVSNHDDFLRRWVIKHRDWTTVAIENRGFLLRMATLMESHATLTPEGFPHYPSPFPWLVAEAKIPNVHILKPGESLVIGKYECQYHGHSGPNGARGSLRNLSRIGSKTMIAHGHGPGEHEGSMQVGHSAREGQPYTAQSPSSWLWAHGLILANGKAQLIVIVKGRATRGY